MHVIYNRDFLMFGCVGRKKLKCLYTRIAWTCTYIKQIFEEKKKFTVSCMHVECDVYREQVGKWKIECLLLRCFE